MIPVIGKESRGVRQLIVALRRRGLMRVRVKLTALPSSWKGSPRSQEPRQRVFRGKSTRYSGEGGSEP